MAGVKLLILVLGMSLLPATASAETVADWKMNEGQRARVMHDTTGDHNARIRRKVTPGGGVFRFIGLRLRAETNDPRRIIAVPESDELDPQDQRYSVTIRFRTRPQVPGPNLIQKGQSGIAGGYWKVEVHKGRPTCAYRDSDGVSTARRGPDRVDDWRWHTIRCIRTTTGLRLVVKTGQRKVVVANSKPIGTVDNDRPLSIGGKYDCEGIDKIPARSCDYLRGQIDYVRIRKG